MDKNEILEKSRKDNGLVDERFKLLEQRKGLITMSAAAVAFILLYMWELFHGRNTDGLYAVFFTGLSTMMFCQAYQLRMKSLLFFGLFTASFVVHSAIRYVLATM
ncbi:DUF6442 family protein [Arabiibacter massiliensis]|uniref:DUF6442 family protein n=1 Tax=Arabiibacter massiliensis TaxID=1870985 RepID=UPI0009B9D4B8|nr:DUF6442 family protein [Arabiibacter massiliensis]